MARKNVEGPQSLRSLLTRSPEMQQVARHLSVLAIAQDKQEGHLSVRQSEQLRRALATAGEALGWSGAEASDPAVITELAKAVLAIAKSGAKTMASDLADELARKETELVVLEEISNSTRELAENPDTVYPLQVVYSYTARDASQNMVTKTETIEANDATETQSAADAVTKTLNSRGKLTPLMIIDIQQKQEHLAAVTRTLADFVKTTHQLLREVLAILR